LTTATSSGFRWFDWIQTFHLTMQQQAKAGMTCAQVESPTNVIGGATGVTVATDGQQAVDDAANTEQQTIFPQRKQDERLKDPLWGMVWSQVLVTNEKAGVRLGDAQVRAAEMNNSMN
jgi:hypothetical protein